MKSKFLFTCSWLILSCTRLAIGADTPGIVFGGAQIVGPATAPTPGQVLAGNRLGGLSATDPESLGAKLRRLARQAAFTNPHNRDYMHALEPWQPSTTYYQSKCVVHGGLIFVMVGTSGASGSTGPTSTAPAGQTDSGCTWIYVAPNSVVNTPDQTLVTWTTSLSVTAGQILNVGNSRLYAVTVGGTTSGTTAPSATSGIGISDGSATLSYYAAWKPPVSIPDVPIVTKVSSVPSLTNIYSPSVYPTAVGVVSAQPVAGGSGYAVGDTITLNSTNSVGTQSTILTVASVSSGVVKSVTVSQAGQFTTLPQLLPVTQSSSSGGGTGATFAVRYPDPAWCRLRGGYNAGSSSGTRIFTYTFQPLANTTPLSAGCAIEWVSDADVLAIVTSNAAPHYAVFIDGVRWSFDGLPADTSAAWFHNFDFTQSGGKKVRKWRIEGTTNLDFRGIRVGTASQVWAPDDTDKITAVFISDSIIAGSAYSPFVNGWSFHHQVAANLGWSDPWCLSQGGTGWLTAGGGSTFRFRVAEAATLNPDAWVMMGSTNDSGLAASAIGAEVTTTLTAIRAASAAPVFVLGIISVDDTAYVAGKKIADYETSIAAAVTAQNDSRMFFIPIRNDPLLPWITGSWNNSANTSSANASSRINGNDGIHPSDFGVKLLTGQGSRAILSKIQLVP